MTTTSSVFKPRETSVESYFVKECERRGIFQIKLTGRRSISDRLIVYQGRAVFVEIKRPGGTPRKAQLVRMRQVVEQTGAHAFVADSKDVVKEILNWLQSQQ